MNKFWEVHISNCSLSPLSEVVPASSSSPDSPISSGSGQTEKSFKSLPDFSINDRKVHLNKFEVLLLTPEQVEEFSSKFTTDIRESSEPLYQAWLQLKLSSLPTESQALDTVLGNHTAKNIPKRVTKHKANVPNGPPRYDLSSQEWIDIMQSRENKENGTPKKKKLPNRRPPYLRS